MREEVNKKFQQLQRSKNDLLRDISELSENQLDAETDKGKWSVKEIIYHLYLAESTSLGYILKKTQKIDKLKKAGWLEKLKVALLKIALGLPIKYKAPPPIAKEMPEDVGWEELLMQWGNERDRLFTFIEEFPEDKMGYKIFRHPLLGLLNLPQTLDFLQSHFNHHVPQVKNHLSKFKVA